MSQRKPSVPLPMRGVYAALATPRLPDSLEANGAALLEYIDTISNSGVDGLVLFGSTGEFVHFDLEERMRILSLASKRSRLPLVVNVSHSCYDGVLTLAENAVESGATGILVMPPYFYRYQDGEIFAFYESLCTALARAIPVYLYNIPFFTNPLSAALIERLFSTGHFAGIKDSSGEWPLFEAIHNLRGQFAFQNMVGNERIYTRARQLSADGIVSGVAAAVPELMVALHRAIAEGDAVKTGALDAHLQEFLNAVDRFPATVAIRQAAVVRGWKFDHSALPFDERTLAALREYRTWLERWLPLVLAGCAAA